MPELMSRECDWGTCTGCALESRECHCHATKPVERHLPEYPAATWWREQYLSRAPNHLNGYEQVMIIQRVEDLESTRQQLGNVDELLAKIAELEQERDQARQTAQELNRRNGVLQKVANDHTERGAWHRYFVAALNILRDEARANEGLRSINRELAEALRGVRINLAYVRQPDNCGDHCRSNCRDCVMGETLEDVNKALAKLQKEGA